MAKVKASAARKISLEFIQSDAATPIKRRSALVAGDDIEETFAEYFDGTPARIELMVDVEPVVLIVDDLAPPKKLPRNERATAL